MSLGIEIERKFLIKHMPDQKPIRTHSIKQGYVAREGYNSVRVREKDGKYILSIKTNNNGMGRNELEYEISAEEGEVLFNSVPHDVIEKTREIYEINGLIWELDVFSGQNKGLIIAEVELNSIDQSIDFPDWVGPEVTELSKFYNANLASRPFNKWRVTYDALLDRLSG